MGGSSKKESRRADDIARQERERAAAQAESLRQQQEAAAAQLMREIQAVTAVTPLESQTQQQLTGLQPQLSDILLESARGQVSPLRTPLALSIEQRLLSDLGRESPEPVDVLAPSLALLRNEVGNFAARRGIVGSGLELEQMGRAGVELAIKQALAREQIRQQNEQLRQNYLAQALSGQQSLESIGASRRGELSGFVQNLQALEDARRAREIGAVSGAAQSGAGIRQTGNVSALERLNQADARALGVESSQLEAQRQARAAQQAAIGKLIGTTVGAAAGIPFGPAGISQGAQIGGSIYGGGGGMSPLSLISLTPQPVDTQIPGASQLRATQRTPRGLQGGYREFYERFV